MLYMSFVLCFKVLYLSKQFEMRLLCQLNVFNPRYCQKWFKTNKIGFPLYSIYIYLHMPLAGMVGKLHRFGVHFKLYCTHLMVHSLYSPVQQNQDLRVRYPGYGCPYLPALTIQISVNNRLQWGWTLFGIINTVKIQFCFPYSNILALQCNIIDRKKYRVNNPGSRLFLTRKTTISSKKIPFPLCLASNCCCVQQA